jgi:hypothetical protein
MALLTTPHERALTLLFAEIGEVVARHPKVLLGTPGSLDERTNEYGRKYWVRRYSDAVGRRLETYLGITSDPEVVTRMGELEAQIAATNAIISQVRLLARVGFVTVDRKAYYTLASLHNHGLFRAGALVIGSHAYGALLNALGVKSVAYTTEDVDIARREELALPGVPPFIDMLRETGIDFFAVPALDARQPSTSFAEPGGSKLRVDLLVPSRGEDYPTIAVPELKAHAKGLPYLGYLLGASQELPILSPHGAVLVRVPVPERYAVHKLIVSQLRARTSSKPEKDLRQAAILIEALIERFPGAVEDALAAVPKSASKFIKLAKKALERHLPETAIAAWEALA